MVVWCLAVSEMRYTLHSAPEKGQRAKLPLVETNRDSDSLLDIFPRLLVNRRSVSDKTFLLAVNNLRLTASGYL